MFFKFSEMPVKEISAGFYCRLVHTVHNTINFLEVKAGSQMPMHSHPHEQSSYVLQGQFEMTIAGETRILDADNYCVIPGGVVHGGRAITDCKLIDVFCPVRQDFVQL